MKVRRGRRRSHSGKCGRAAGRLPLLLDGTDNFETRLLVNDYAVKQIRALGLCRGGLQLRRDHGHPSRRDGLPGVPDRRTATRQRMLGHATRMSRLATRSGVLAPAAGVIASLEAAPRSSFCSASPQPLDGRLISCDVWTADFSRFAWRGAQIAAPAAPRIPLSGRRGAAAPDDVRPRFGADSRAAPAPGSGGALGGNLAAGGQPRCGKTNFCCAYVCRPTN